MKEKRRILIATAFPTHGAGSGALVTTQAKSYVEDGHEVVIITGNNRTDFDKLEGARYHIVPFTAETENPEKIPGQVPFNYLMFTTHTESTANFWNVGLEEIEKYTAAFRTALQDEVKTLNPDVIHAQHNWLLSATAVEMGKPVVTTIHGTDLMGYERSKKELAAVEKELAAIEKSSKAGKIGMTAQDIAKVKEIYARSSSVKEIREKTKELFAGDITGTKAEKMSLVQVLDSKKKYEMFIAEAEKSAKESEQIIVISDAQKEKFMELFPFATQDKVVLLENGYDPKTFFVDKTTKREDVIPALESNIAEDGKIPMDADHYVLFVGKFADFKGIDSLLTASKLYADKAEAQGKKVETIIVGSGALDDKLRAEQAQLGLTHTHFVGRKGPDVIRPLQNLSTVSLIPSRDEPFGLVVIEGTACGHPVIGSNSGGIPGILNTEKVELPKEDVIQTKLGLLVKPLPVRPEVLSQDQKDELDVFATDYVVADEEGRKEVASASAAKLGLSAEEATTYLSEYAKSTEALAEAVSQIVEGRAKFDNDEIARYTEETYSQAVIRDKLFGIFDKAVDLHKKKSIEQR